MNSTKELYQHMVMEHYRNPCHYGAHPEWSHHARGYNPLCGDEVDLFVDLDGERIRALSFTSKGCAICKSSASMMSQALTGLPIDQAHLLSNRFGDLVQNGAEADPLLGDMAVFASLRDYPSRVKCATLPWQTLDASLTGEGATATTE